MLLFVAVYFILGGIIMVFQEPKVEFVTIDLCDIMTSSGEQGQQIDICTGHDKQICEGPSM